jgi:hypothetical protein
MASSKLPLLVLRLEIEAGKIVDRMSSWHDAFDYFKSAGAARCFDGEAISFSVARTNCERSKYESVYIGDATDDPRFIADDE